MRNIYINILAFLLPFYLCQCEAKDRLQDIAQDNAYTVEICFFSGERYAGLDTTKELGDYTEKIIYRGEIPRYRRFGELVNALRKHSPRDGKPIDVKWSIVIRELEGKEISTCCFDAWGLDGYLDGVPVTFSNDTGIWLRKYLTEIFELKNEPIGTTPLPYISPNAVLTAQLSEFIALAPLVIGLAGLIIYLGRRRNRKKLF